MPILSSAMLDSFDRCERRFAYSREFVSKSISSLALLYHALNSALINPDPEQTAKDATIKLAQTRELQLFDLNAFMVIRHIGYLAGIIATALQNKFGILTRLAPTDCHEFEWHSDLFETASGTRHRIVLVSHLDDDRLRAEAHSWATIGELAALQSPLTLTAIIIGAHRGGRRHSPWAKGLLHPQNHSLRFAARQRMKGSGLNSGWEEVWREHKGEISTAQWLDRMAGDGVLDQHILSREIRFSASDNRLVVARREMIQIMRAMKSASEDSPMRRSSCDETGRGACEFQAVCYSPVPTDPSQLVHLFTRSESR